MKQNRLLALAAASLLAGVAAASAESVNWSLTVAAEESYQVQEVQLTDLWASFADQGSLGGVVPPAGTTGFDVAITMVEPGYPEKNILFPGLSNTHGKYAVWFGSIGGNWHRVILFGGSVGGTVLGFSEFQCQEPGYHNMHVVFAWATQTTAIRTISATDSGSMEGGVGETKQAPWSAAPIATPGASVGPYRYELSGSNPAVVLNHSVDGTGAAGLVTAQFPACVASSEVCDGKDNDCNGQVDEAFTAITCGMGLCQNTINSCENGSAMICDPLKGSTAEACDGADNDCDGIVDNGCTALDLAPSQIESLSLDPAITPQAAGKLSSAVSLIEEAKSAAAAGDWAAWSKALDQAVKDFDAACLNLDANTCSAIGTSLARYAYDTSLAQVSARSGSVKPNLIDSANSFLGEARIYLDAGDYRSSVAKSINAAKKVS